MIEFLRDINLDTVVDYFCKEDIQVVKYKTIPEGKKDCYYFTYKITKGDTTVQCSFENR